MTSDRKNRASSSYSFDFRNKVGVITGGGGSICSVVARELAAFGLKIAVLDIQSDAARKVSAEILNEGGQAIGLGCDVLNLNELQQVHDRIAETWAKPDFLINGAGGNNLAASTEIDFLEVADGTRETETSFLNIDMAGFERTLRLNFLGTVLPCQVFSKGMIERGSGAIVNFASMSGFVPLTRIPAYSAAKAAVANFTRWLSVHYSHSGVRVNAVAPGFVMTEQLKFLHIDLKTGEYTPRARNVIAHTPMGRYAEPSEVAGAVAWLLSDAARFVTGDVVPIDGGFSSFSI